jgi:hypothetical protein
MSVDEMSVKEALVVEILVDEMSVKEALVVEILVDEMLLDEMSVDKMTCCHKNKISCTFWNLYCGIKNV